MLDAAGSQHWMVHVAQRAGLENAGTLDITAQLPAAEAWDAVARHCEVPQEELATHVAAHFRLRCADLSAAEPEAAKLIPETFARRYKVIPVRQGYRELVGIGGGASYRR